MRWSRLANPLGLTPVYNGLTDTWHPTQMLADFLTMAEHADVRDWSEISYCYLGDARPTWGNLLVTGAILGATFGSRHRRSCGRRKRSGLGDAVGGSERRHNHADRRPV